MRGREAWRAESLTKIVPLNQITQTMHALVVSVLHVGRQVPAGLFTTTVVHTCMYNIYSHRKRWVNRALVLMVELRDIQFDELF